MTGRTGAARRVASTAAVLALVAACAGGSGASSAPSSSASASAGGTPASSPAGSPAGDAVQVVQVRMLDTLRYEPDPIRVRPGKVRFEVTNAGQTVHEFFIGTEVQQDEHEREMRAGDGHAHAETPMLELEGGKSGTVEVTFDAPGETLVGCHEPGHYPGGMKARIIVEG